PEMSSMLRRGMFHPSDPAARWGPRMLRRSARKAIRAALARPSVGGVVREIFRAPACVPVMALRFAPGWTRTERMQPPSVGRRIVGLIGMDSSSDQEHTLGLKPIFSCPAKRPEPKRLGVPGSILISWKRPH